MQNLCIIKSCFQPILLLLTFVVETFILLGGLLTAYATFKDKDFSSLTFLCISSLCYLFIFVVANKVIYFQTGIMQSTGKWCRNTCQQYWWTNTLYIHNNVPVLSSYILAICIYVAHTTWFHPLPFVKSIALLAPKKGC